ncbi:MAG: pseudouridine synthase [Butyrivibrio sp.]|nr:pseudouridine synthase [Muribaculum sp.]MCM1553862.1 pseudouridine synthase [Butyrivibrio sp.]
MGNSDDRERMRLNKYLAQCGVCSRRDADKLIASGKVLVNGKTATLGQSVSNADSVQVGKKVFGRVSAKAVLAFYKPVGVTCTERDAHAERKITDIIQYPLRVTYAGRLDKDSEGLLLLTNDGDLIDAMMRGANGHEKEYLVKVNKEITSVFLSRMKQGVYLQELKTTTRPCEVAQVGKYTLRIVLTQGLNRQIRRMCKELGYQVQSLKRVRVMNILLGDLKPGEYRELSEQECAELYEQAAIERQK